MLKPINHLLHKFWSSHYYWLWKRLHNNIVAMLFYNFSAMSLNYLDTTFLKCYFITLMQLHAKTFTQFCYNNESAIMSLQHCCGPRFNTICNDCASCLSMYIHGCPTVTTTPVSILLFTPVEIMTKLQRKCVILLK